MQQKMHAVVSLARLANTHLHQQGSQIGEPFFSALERVCSIHANCRSLLRTQHQRAGLELMDLMSSYQETAYEHLCRSAAYIRPDMPYRASDILSSLMGSLHRQHPGELGTAWSEIQTHTIGNAKIDGGLARVISHMLDRACACHQSICGHRWVQGECRRLGDTDAPEVDPMLQRAASALRERPVLFKYCAAEVAGARHNALFQRSVPPASSVQQHPSWLNHQYDNMQS